MSRWIEVEPLISDLDKGLWGKDWDKVLTEAIINDAPSIDIVRCKECRWYDPPHILHKDGTRTDVDEGSPWVTVDVGINCGGQCIHHIGLKTYCVNHDRENPDDNESIVIFRSPDDFCSYGEREGE